MWVLLQLPLRCACSLGLGVYVWRPAAGQQVMRRSDAGAGSEAGSWISLSCSAAAIACATRRARPPCLSCCLAAARGFCVAVGDLS